MTILGSNTIQERIERLDLQTVRLLTAEAEKHARAATGWTVIAQHRLSDTKPIDAAAKDVLGRVSIELADEAGQLHQAALALVDLIGGDGEHSEDGYHKVLDQ